MDPFTQRMLEKAEQRSRALGISSAGTISQLPLSECSSSTRSDNKANVESGNGVCATTSTMAANKLKMQQQQQEKFYSTSINNTRNMNKLQVVEKNSTDIMQKSQDGSPKRVLRQFAAVDKENMDLGIEINIMTDKNVEVQVQVEEGDDHSNDAKPFDKETIQQHPQQQQQQQQQQQSIVKLRDTSRNRLQRLGALYSNTAEISSPIHRTEGQFHAGSDDEDNICDSKARKNHHGLGKLAALATTINQWEDDTNHYNVNTNHAPPPKPDLPSRGQFSFSTTNKTTETATTTTTVDSIAKTDNDNKTKQLEWDPKVINSLEAQGFQRRDSSTVKVSYDFNKEQQQKQQHQQHLRNKIEEKVLNVDCEKNELVGKMNVMGGGKGTMIASSEQKLEKCAQNVERKLQQANIKTGLVSGRAAIFENQSQQQQAYKSQQQQQKDPTELSLKERMKLFERNKGEALVPRAAFGMAAPLSKLLQESCQTKQKIEEQQQHSQQHQITNPPLVKANAESNVRDKVAALVSAANENKIKDDIRKQREEDMQLLTNRFHKQREAIGNHQQQQQQQQQQQHNMIKEQVKATAALLSTNKKEVKRQAPAPPPPPPPPPPLANTTPQPATAYPKRRSSGDAIEDESKRARKSNNRLYPGLSDLDSNEESYSDSENNCCTTATITADEAANIPLTGNNQQDYDEPAPAEEDSYMETDEDDDEDDDDEEEEEESSDNNTGAGCNKYVAQNKDKQQQQRKNIKNLKVRYSNENQYIQRNDEHLVSSTNSSDASLQIDDYLDEALDEQKDESQLSRDSVNTTASHSFTYRKSLGQKQSVCQILQDNNSMKSPTTSTTITTTNSAVTNVCSEKSHMLPVKSELSVNKDDDNMVTLVHTVSFYRRQQNTSSANTTPVRKITREQQTPRLALKNFDNESNYEGGVGHAAATSLKFNESIPEGNENENEDDGSDSQEEDVNEQRNERRVQEKIKRLLDEVCKQQQIIAQTSQALNLCAATIEFSGSTESVEGERHLLVATHRRQSCLDEIQRLRVEKTIKPFGGAREKGRLTVKEITVPLRQDYIRKLASDTISGHHLVCLLKYNEHVLATKSIPTLPGLLAVKFPDILQVNDAYADFKVTIEVYGMTAQREVLPHEVKYHINMNKKSGVKTPKRKGAESRLIMPPVQSPAGPIIRTPALVQYGFAIFSIKEIQRTNWTLTQVLGVSPLEGILHMKLNCELSVTVEHKGFLTMYEDISGFGAWHRRWCCLNGSVLNYWKYPDDEKTKAPIGSIDLYTCCARKVTIAPRDICARLNTILLECQRPATENDQQSLIIIPSGRTTIVRYLLSADTREEREEWCAFLNKTLTLLRAWGPPQ